MRRFSKAIGTYVATIACGIAGAVLGVAGLVAYAQQGGQSLMTVDWNDPEIKTFVREQATNPPLSVGPEDAATLSKLKLPVLAFDRPPGVVGRAFGIGTEPERQREIVSDPDNPVWYTVVDNYDDMTITVEADLRVQQVLPEGTAIYTPPRSASQEPNIDIIDSTVEEGMEGLIAEYTVQKFPDIPYRVTIECSEKTKNHCTDGAAILKDRMQLRVISARPPG